MAEEISLEDYKKVHREIIIESERRGFKIHLTAYLVINAVLIISNLVFTPDKLWFLWPVSGWGIGILSHYIKAVHRIEGDLKKKEAIAERRVKELGR
ncbi:MAG: 2TM domain-containing protein [Euryarchaeota archaeon]|nr:2TM domain-containing protein [Euryarchaeota archaeon]